MGNKTRAESSIYMTLEERFLKEYDIHADSVFRFCLFKLSDREEAKDVVQETFTKSWSYLANGGEIRNVKAFLFRTARNLIIDKYRKKKTESLDSMTDAGFDPEYIEDREIGDTVDAEIAMKLLDGLPPDYREVILMRYVEEMSVGEISEALGERAGNVSVKLHRAMSKLKSLYKAKNV